MIRLSRREHDLLAYAQTDSADLSRDNLATVANVIPVSVGRILTALRKRGLVTIERGPNRRILSITPTFEMARNVTFYVGNPSRKS
jgi:DNA-binding MarR family transcriptional regulator